jgi:hypothetical protein
MSTKFSLPALVKDTRTRTKKFSSKRGGEGGLLPGAYSSYGVYSPSSAAPSLWSPYARPPRRSKKLVLLWLFTLFIIGSFTWYLSRRRSAMSETFADVLAEAPPKEAVVDQ